MHLKKFFCEDHFIYLVGWLDGLKFIIPIKGEKKRGIKRIKLYL